MALLVRSNQSLRDMRQQDYEQSLVEEDTTLCYIKALQNNTQVQIDMIQQLTDTMIAKSTQL